MNFCSALIIMSLIPNCAERVRGSEREKKRVRKGSASTLQRGSIGRGGSHWDLGLGEWILVRGGS